MGMVFKFSKISDNISETVQDRQIGNHIWAIEWHDCWWAWV